MFFPSYVSFTVFTINSWLIFISNLYTIQDKLTSNCEVIEIQSINIHKHTHTHKIKILQHFMFYRDINKFNISFSLLWWFFSYSFLRCFFSMMLKIQQQNVCIYKINVYKLYDYGLLFYVWKNMVLYSFFYAKREERHNSLSISLLLLYLLLMYIKIQLNMISIVLSMHWFVN